MINLLDFIKDNRLFKKLYADALLFTEYKCLVNEDRGEVWSPANYFAFGISGKKGWQSSKDYYLVEPGNLLFIKKGANAVYQYFEEEFLVLFIFVPDEFIKTVIEKHQLNFDEPKRKIKRDSIVPIKTDEVLDTYFQSLLAYFNKSNTPPPSLLKLKFEELLVSLIHSNKNQELIQYFRDIYKKNKISIKEIMEANFTTNLSLNEYAKLSARSISTFKRDFFYIYKNTPGKWLKERRLEHSKYLLQNTNKNIGEIILDSGFKSRSHFIKIFKSKYGLSPSRIRSKKHPLRKVI